MNFFKIFTCKVAFSLLLVFAFTSTSLIQAIRCGCGSRASSGRSSGGGRGGRGYRGARGRSGVPRTADDNAVTAMMASPFLAFVLFRLWQMLKGFLFPDWYADCTCPIADHELTWFDRILILIITGGLAFLFSPASYQNYVVGISLILMSCYLFYERLTMLDE